MELAILFVARDLAVGVRNERDRLARDGGESIRTRGPQRVLGFIQNGEEPVAVHHFKRMAGRVGVGANVVRQMES